MSFADTNSQGTKHNHKQTLDMHTDTYDYPCVSCMWTSAGNETVLISSAERKLRLVVCRLVSLLCCLISGESKVTKPQATSQSADCDTARLLYKAWFTVYV